MERFLLILGLIILVFEGIKCFYISIKKYNKDGLAYDGNTFPWLESLDIFTIFTEWLTKKYFPEKVHIIVFKALHFFLGLLCFCLAAIIVWALMNVL